MGYTWMPQTDVMKVNTPPILIGKKWKGKFTANAVWYDKPTVTNEYYGTKTLTKKMIVSKIARFYDSIGFYPLKNFGKAILMQVRKQVTKDPENSPIGP